MSKYTTEVRFICETYAGLEESEGYESVDEIIGGARSKVFDFDYPIFDEAYRPVLEKKILKHYYTREICAETVGLWKLWLSARMNEIMPYYNQLYKSELLEFNPFYDVDYTKDGTRNRDEDNLRTDDLANTSVTGGSDSTTRDTVTGGSDVLNDRNVAGGTDTRNENGKTGGQDTTNGANINKYSEWDLYSDTPQGGIEGILGAEDEPSLEDNGYLTNARHILHDGTGSTITSTTNYGKTDTTNQTTQYGRTDNRTATNQYGKTVDEDATYNYGRTVNGTNTGTVRNDNVSTEQYLENVRGKMSTTPYSKLLQDYRDTFLNIDMLIIKSLADLFFNLW